MNPLIKRKNWVAYGLTLLVVIIVYGAIPFYSIPHLGSVIWTSGFAQSFVNAGWPAIQAINFGIPENASMAFGLAGAFLQSTFMALLHLHPSDAYAFGTICWMALALWGCIRLGHRLGASFLESCFLSLVYLTLPFVWWHAHYGLLSMGFALLPLYLYSGLKVVYDGSEGSSVPRKWLVTTASFAAVSLLSVFIDGYSFVMFFAACGMIWIVAFLRKDSNRGSLLLKALPTIFLSAILSYLLYTLYLGKTSFPPSSMDFFRAWGVDVTMLFAPSQEISWLWDALDVSVERNREMFFGDESVWMTTFALPMILVGGLGYWWSQTNRFALPLLLIALVGLYFSLGPSLKINSTRPQDVNGAYLIQGALMPADAAIAPTGSEIIYGHIPGFSNMRATYRWIGITFTALFGLTVLFYLNGASRGYRPLMNVILGLLIVSNLPNLSQRLSESRDYHAQIRQIDRDLADLSTYVGKDAIVFFAPPGNDMIVNYVASMGNYKAYNIGGDKNVEMAREHWPDVLGSFRRAIQQRPAERAIQQPPLLEQAEQCFAQKIGQVLTEGVADFVVIPYFDLLWGAHTWPSAQVIAQKNEFLPTIDYFQEDALFVVKDEKYYAVISLSPNADYAAITKKANLRLNQPISLGTSCTAESMLKRGWHSIESWGVWSGESAELVIPIGDECQDVTGCSLQMTFRVFGATKNDPRTVLVNLEGASPTHWSVDTGEMREYIVPLPLDLLRSGPDRTIILEILVPEATSPNQAGVSADTRVLGIGLSQLELLPNTGKEKGN